MTKIFLPIIVLALLVTLGFAQAPPASSTDQTSIKGCLSGSDGNYILAEQGTSQTFKITTSAVDLEPHVGHQVELTGQKVTPAATPGAADNSLTVTAVNMISDNCTAASSNGPAESTPNATASSAPAERGIASTADTATAPADSGNTSAATPSTPPAETNVTPSATASQAQTTGRSTSAAVTATTPADGANTSAATPSTPRAETNATPSATATTQAETTNSSASAAVTAPSETGADTTTATSRPTAEDSTTTRATASASGENGSEQRLPNTASPLPLLGIVGLGLLIAGLLSSRRWVS